MISVGKIEKTCLFAFCIRLLVLVIVVLFAKEVSLGFYGTDLVDLDDCRYLAGAEVYMNNASSIVDVDCFTKSFAQFGDRTGYILNEPTSTPFWYWVVCITAYLTKTTFSIRLLNVILGTASVYYVYTFTKQLYGEREALLAARLIAFLPYPVFFSCFAYKDPFLLFCTFFILNGAMIFQTKGKISIIRLLLMAGLALAMLKTRSGLTSLFLIVVFLIAFKKYIAKLNTRNIILSIVLVSIAIFVLYKSSSTILYKMNYYFERNMRTVSGPIRHIMITKLTDIYKLPFCYLISVIEPIGLPDSITSWSNIVDLCFPLMVPISTGSFLYMFTRKKKEWYTFWLCMGVYLATIVASLTNIRHYYSMLPITYIAFSKYILSLHGAKKVLFITANIGAIIVVYALYMYTH